MDKKTLITSAAITVALAGVGIKSTAHVHADELDDASVETQAQVSDSLDTVKEEIDTAKTDADTAQAATDAQQEVVDNAQASADTAQEEATQADDVYNQAQEDAANATDKNIADANQAISDANQTVTEAQDALPTVRDEADKADQAVTEQQGVVSDANQTVADTKADVDSAQTAVDTAQKIVDGEQSDADAQQTLADANAAQQKAEDAVNKATAEEAVAEKADDERQTAIDNANADVEKASQTDTGAISQEIADANKTIAESDAKIADADKTIAEADKTISENTDKIKEIEENTATTPTAPKPTLPKGYDLSGTGGYKAMKAAKQATMELNKSYKIPMFNIQTNATETDRNTTVDISNPTEEQLKTINEYAAQVINDLRKQLGKSNVAISTNSINVAVQVANQYKADNWFAFDNNKGHDDSALTTGAASANSSYSSECLSLSYTNNRYMTMAQIKNDIYDSIVSMVFATDELDHADIILKNPTQMGVTYSFFSNYNGLGDFAQIHFVFSVPLAGNTDANDIADYVTTYEKAEETAKAEQAKEIAAYQGTIDSATATKKEAKSAKAKATTTKTDATAKKTDAEKRLADAKQALSDAQAKYEAAVAVPEQTATAKAKLASAQANLATAKANVETAQKALDAIHASQAEKEETLKQAKADLADKIVAWTEAKDALAKEIAKLNKLQSVSTEKQEALSDAIDAVTAAKQSLEDAINYLNRLENSQNNLSKAAAAKTEADAKLATAKAELETELAKLATLKETSDAAQAKYNDVKARYDALVKAQEELNNKGEDTPTVDEKSDLEKAKEAKESELAEKQQELSDAKAAVAQQEENIKGVQEWFDDQMAQYLANGGKVEDLDPNSYLAHRQDKLRTMGVELNEARDKQASIEQDIATLTSEIADLDEQIKKANSKKDEPTVPTTPETPTTPEVSVAPTTSTDVKPSTPVQTNTNNQAAKEGTKSAVSANVATPLSTTPSPAVITAAYHEVVTKAETQKVIDRRGVPTYQATAELPNTGDDNTATFTLMGLAIAVMGMFGATKLKGKKDC